MIEIRIKIRIEIRFFRNNEYGYLAHLKPTFFNVVQLVRIDDIYCMSTSAQNETLCLEMRFCSHR